MYTSALTLINRELSEEVNDGLIPIGDGQGHGCVSKVILEVRVKSDAQEELDDLNVAVVCCRVKTGRAGDVLLEGNW